MAAPMLGLPFVDTDALIENRLGATVATIFSEKGEQHFRQVEAEVVQTVLSGPASVIALGGGALLNESTREQAERDAVIMNLTCSPAEIERRLGHDGVRPLLASDPSDAWRPAGKDSEPDGIAFGALWPLSWRANGRTNRRGGSKGGGRSIHRPD